jgi:hypothetical protein
VLKPGGLFVITTPLNFRIHAYPDDYWRLTPTCLRRLLAPYEAKVSGFQGHDKFPHTVMAVARKAPAESDFAERACDLNRRYADYLLAQRRNQPLTRKVRHAISWLHRSKFERQQMQRYHSAHMFVDQAEAVAAARRQAG